MNTTISISQEMKEKLRNLGKAGDTYEDVIKKIYDIANEHILISYLHDTSDSVPIQDAIKEARKRWPKSS